jgi:hypothetical protein
VENIDSTRFVVLTGHLDEQPLPDLIRRLRVLKKSGRLQVEYADTPGAFFFEDGQLVDAQLGSLRGVEALYSALALGGASFNFNPLVRPPERSIDRQGQQFIRDLVESSRREGITELRAVGTGLDPEQTASPSLPHGARLQLPPAAELMAPLEERLTAVEEAIHTTSHRFSRERLIYAVVIGFLAGLSIVTTLGVIYGPFRAKPSTVAGSAIAGPVAASDKAAATGSRVPPDAGKGKEQESVAAGSERGGVSQASNSSQSVKPATQGAQPPVPSSAAVISTRKFSDAQTVRGAYVVQVLVEVKDGRVTDARVWNPRPGAGAYESVALKMARERRYPERFSGNERLRIIVKP